MKFALIKERKNPIDRRVVFSPEAGKQMIDAFPQATLTVESSDARVFSDAEYQAEQLQVSKYISDCDVLLGVKEVPIEALIPNKKYFFFSHTIKKQPHNQKLLQAILEKNIELYDHELITDKKNNRLVTFGYYAGIVGAYNGLRAFGKKQNLFNLPKAEVLPNQEALIDCLNQVSMPPIKILLTGKGRVGKGAKEVLDKIKIPEVTVNQFLNQSFKHAVYCNIDVLDYNKRKDGKNLGEKDFFTNPEAYKSNFMRFAKQTELYIAAHFYADGAPHFFTNQDTKSKNFNIKVIADISCDIKGPIASTLRASTVANPIYGYHPKTNTEVDYRQKDAIAVMAVDNLPCELPADASIDFGTNFLNYIIPAFFNNDKDGILKRARITKDGKLTKAFAYLQDYVSGK